MQHLQYHSILGYFQYAEVPVLRKNKIIKKHFYGNITQMLHYTTVQNKVKKHINMPCLYILPQFFWKDKYYVFQSVLTYHGHCLTLQLHWKQFV